MRDGKCRIGDARNATILGGVSHDIGPTMVGIARVRVSTLARVIHAGLAAPRFHSMQFTRERISYGVRIRIVAVVKCMGLGPYFWTKG